MLGLHHSRGRPSPHSFSDVCAGALGPCRFLVDDAQSSGPGEQQRDRCQAVSRPMQRNYRKQLLKCLVGTAIGILAIAHLTGTTEAATYRSFVAAEAVKYGVDPVVAVWIVKHESQFDPSRTGDDGNSRGLWQISRVWHPEVSDRCAFDAVCSTRWSLAHIKAGHAKEWSTYRFCRQWYRDCPL